LVRASIKLFVTATHVRTGRGRVFRNADLSPDALLASGCLPTMAFFCMLRDQGRRVATAFLDAHGADLGVRSTLDIDAYLEGI
ncbi:MAG: hypothetical protein WCA12_02720, partial [Burkholderiales bacterium]